ncbi:hypothetical protein [Candidatus Tisiphia endosymbiont of Dascillus cervinus]|uniref:hypothetical protein n=1 Tax=Candidatus Tisiphia endosymbiont of Dascillus cervinus TaxID=3066253 RepID=UPI00312C8057
MLLVEKDKITYVPFKIYLSSLLFNWQLGLNRMSDAILKYEASPQIIKSITSWNWIINPINSLLKDN